jgi:hypothetical protein
MKDTRVPWFLLLYVLDVVVNLRLSSVCCGAVRKSPLFRTNFVLLCSVTSSLKRIYAVGFLLIACVVMLSVGFLFALPGLFRKIGMQG